MDMEIFFIVKVVNLEIESVNKKSGQLLALSKKDRGISNGALGV